MLSVVSEMRTLLDEPSPDEWENFFGELFDFCSRAGVSLEAQDPGELLAEVGGWCANSDLATDDVARLQEFAATLKRMVRGAAHAAGRAVGTARRATAAYHRAKSGVRKFAGSVKHAYQAGAHHGQGSKPKPGVRPRRPGAAPKKRRPGAPPKSRKPGKPGKRRPKRSK